MKNIYYCYKFRFAYNIYFYVSADIHIYFGF